MTACPSKPSKSFKPKKEKPYIPEVGDFSYVGGIEA
jgi:hypothetical protein